MSTLPEPAAPPDPTPAAAPAPAPEPEVQSALAGLGLSDGSVDEGPPRENVLGWIRIAIGFLAVSAGPLWLFASGMVYQPVQDRFPPVWIAVIVSAVLGAVVTAVLLPLPVLLAFGAALVSGQADRFAARRRLAAEAAIDRDAALVGVVFRSRTVATVEPARSASPASPASSGATSPVAAALTPARRLELKLERADPGVRAVAALIDGALGVALFPLGPFALAAVLGASFDVSVLPEPVLAVVFGAGMVAVTALQIGQWALLSYTGQSLGKRLLGVRVVSLDGRPVGFAEAVFLRIFVFRWLCGVPLVGTIGALVDVASLFFDRDGRTLHDKLAGTRVVRVT